MKHEYRLKGLTDDTDGVRRGPEESVESHNPWQSVMQTPPPGYRQTKVGVIPQGWKVRTLEEFAHVIMGQSPIGTSYNQRGIGTALINGPTEFTEKYPIKKQWTTLPTKFCEMGDVLLCVRGSSTGRINIANDEYCIGRGIAAIRAKSNSDNSFLVFQIQIIVDRILALTAGSTFPNIDGRSLRGIQVALPPLPEQRAIADALSDVDGLITALDKLIAKKRDVKQAAMQELLTGKRRLPGFDGEWIVLNIAANSVLKARIGWQGLTTAEYLGTGEYFLVTGTDFVNGKIDWTRCHFVDSWRYDQDKNIQLCIGDVLITKDGTIGKVAYIDHLPSPATLNSGVFVIRPKNDKYHPLYLYYILNSRIFEAFLNQLQAGSTISHLYQKDFVGFKFSAPPSLDEQKAISAVLSDMDTEIAALEQKREKTRLLKQGMMQELLTGRIRLVLGLGVAP